jgi:hypothetical protein
MEKYALIKDNTVINIIVVNPNDQDFNVNALVTDEISIIHDVNNQAFINGTWNSSEQKFYPPKPYPSWVWNEQLNNWVAPKELPTTNGQWVWDESVVDYKNQAPKEPPFGNRFVED